MSDVRKDVGIVTAYGYAVEGGYQGTEAQYTELMGSIANIAQEATDAKTAAETAQGKAEDAQEAAETAQGKAEDAQEAAERAQGLADDAKSAANDSATSASKSALKAEGFAVGEQNEVEVGSDSPYYHNNAKYYSEEAGDSATQAAASAATSAAMTGLAPQFVSTKDYLKGDQVLQNGTYYEFTADHAAGAWTGTDVKTVLVSDQVSSLKSHLKALATGTAQIGMGYVQGVRYTDSPTTVSTSSTRCTSQKPISMGANDVIEITIPSGLKVSVITTLGTDSGWKTSTYTFKATAACDVYLNAAKTSDGGVVPSEISGVIIRYTDNSSRISTLERDYEKTEDAFNDLGIIFPVENPGYISGTGTIVPDSSANLAVHTDMLPVNIGDSLQIELRYTEEHSLWAAYALYRADGTYITRISLTSDTTASEFLGTVTIENASAKFISFTYRTFGEANAIVYKRSVPYNSELATLIPANSTYPSIDTTAKTFTIPVDTVLIDKRLTNGYAAIPATVCDYSSISSTAIMFAWDVDNATVTAMAYGAQPNYEKHIILCTLRSSKGLVGSAIPVMVDGMLYGVVDPNHINQGSVWKNENVKGINHRGYTVVAPENTLPAFKLSKDMGFEYVETDVRFTSDGVPVLLHDATINRTARNSDGTAISGTVNIADITYTNALTYDYGIWKGAAYAGTPIPTFAQFLKACRRLGLRPYIELKAGTQAQVEGLVDTAIASGFKGLCTWISYNDEYLTYVKNHASGERLGLVADTYSSALINTINSLKTPDNEVFLDMTVLSPINSTVVEALISAGIALECFINGNYSIIGANSYITGITTDSGNVGQYMYMLWSHNIYT